MRTEQSASDNQRKMFFALINDLGHDPIEAKERAKKKYNLISFKDITNWQIQKLLDFLVNQQMNRDYLREKERGFTRIYE